MSPDPLDPSRRYFLGQCTGLSLGAMALSTLVGRALAADSPGKPGLPHLPHFAAKARPTSVESAMAPSESPVHWPRK